MQVQPELENYDDNIHPVKNFLFALKAPESKRQYPKRFEKFLDFLKLKGTFEDMGLSLYNKALKNPQWLTNKLVEFAQYQNQRVQTGEISESTIPNYFESIKLDKNTNFKNSISDNIGFIYHISKFTVNIPNIVNNKKELKLELEKLLSFRKEEIENILYVSNLPEG